MTILLVRHAHAGEREEWNARDVARPLTPAGRRQALALVRLLSTNAVGRIVSSPAVRCLQTVEPLAAARGLAVEQDGRLHETTPTPVVLELLAELGGQRLVLCTHGDVIGPLISALALRGVDVGDDPRWPKGSTWALSGSGSGVTAATYLPPPG